MSRRTLNTQTTNNKPASKFINWDSDEKTFVYYDASLKEKLLSEGKTEQEIREGKLANVKLKLPLKFQFLEDFHTVKGFSESLNCSIYANEFKNMSKDKVIVRAFKSKDPLAEGLYPDIKNDIKAQGGKYAKSIYVLLDGEIVNLSLYGAAVGSYMLFEIGDKKTNTKGHSHLLETNFIEVNDFLEGKKGRTKYTYPVFSPGETYTTEESLLADEKYKEVAEYYKKHTEKNSPVEEIEVNEEEEIEF